MCNLLLRVDHFGLTASRTLGFGVSGSYCYLISLLLATSRHETRKALRAQSRFRVETQCQYTSVSSRYETLSPKTFLLFED